MNYNEAMQYIESLGKFGIHLGMERITGLVELLDHPERKIRTIHITGTNGKGSVASYLSHILTASGKKTACYTSPTLLNIMSVCPSTALIFPMRILLP